MMRGALAAVTFGLGLQHAAGSARLSVYDNTALTGIDSATQSISTNGNKFNFSLPGQKPFSAEMLGTMELLDGDDHTFSCNFGSVDLAFLFIDDHLVCQTGAYSVPPEVTGIDNPLRKLSKGKVPVRLEVYYAAANKEQCKGTESVGCFDDSNHQCGFHSGGKNADKNDWSFAAQSCHESGSRYAAAQASKGEEVWCGDNVPTCPRLEESDCAVPCPGNSSEACGDAWKLQIFEYECSQSPPPDEVTVAVSWSTTSGDEALVVEKVAEVEQTRRTLQKGLATGWGPWVHNSVLKQAHLPSGATLSTALCEVADGVVGDCQEVASPDDGNTRVGPLAYNRSYGQFFLRWHGANVSFAFSAGDELQMLFSLIDSSDGEPSASPGKFSGMAVVIFGSSSWKRVVSVTGTNSSLTLDPYGLDSHHVFAARSDGAESSMRASDSRPHFVLPLTFGQSVGLSTGKAMSVSNIKASLDAARQQEEATYAKYGDLSTAKAAAQAGVMWNWIYNPVEMGPLPPVSRGWDFTKGAVSSDWTYVIFDWDNIFASYLLSLDAKEHAYSSLIQVIKSKTAEGFVPNFAAAQVKSSDRTEPPIGAKVTLEIFKKYGDAWIVELLFDDLLDWSNWFVANRELEPAKLIALGGDGMQGARFESGLDNSPMYDGDFWDSGTKLMQLYDVGMTAMFVMEANALADLADAISRPEGDMLRARGAAMRNLMLDELWDDESGIFVNKRPDGSFYRRISPTSFYPMLTGGPSEEQVESMMSRWMMNSTRFCITPNGDFEGNSDNCYWGLPSISADDEAFPPLGYWRGYVWGPMMQLTYWSLQNYDSIPAARTARKALAKQMTALMLSQWGKHGHICENFGPHKDTDDCTGNKFYHWGALGGFISLIEDGYYFLEHQSDSMLI